MTAQQRRALVFGASGQDGAYLSAFLLGRGYRVIGTSRSGHAPNLAALDIADQVELRALDPADELAGYSGPLLLAQGSNDVLVSADGVPRLTAAHPGDEVLWTAEMDHVFNIEAGAETVDALIAATADFLDAELR